MTARVAHITDRSQIGLHDLSPNTDAPHEDHLPPESRKTRNARKSKVLKIVKYILGCIYTCMYIYTWYEINYECLCNYHLKRQLDIDNIDDDIDIDTDIRNSHC